MSQNFGKIGCLLIILLFATCSDRKTRSIGIQPYDNFDKTLIDTIGITLSHFYRLRVQVLPNKLIPENAFINIKTPRYRADKIIETLKREKPDSLTFLIGLTNHDISTTKRDRFGNILESELKYIDWGVFGLGYRPGPSCIVSTFRIVDKNKKHFIERLKKIVVHEVGHNLGLNHCESDLCVMRDAAETIRTIDKVKLGLCGNCKEQINL